MAKYKVIFTGYADASEGGVQAFLEKFGQAYQKSPAEARVWLKRAGNLVYTFDNEDAARQGKLYLEGLGANARIDVEEDQVPFAPPPPPPPAPEAPSPYGSPGALAPNYAAPGPQTAGGAYPYPYEPAPYHPPAPNYIKNWDLGTIIGDAFDILFKNIGTMVALSAIPMIAGFIFAVVMISVMFLSGGLAGAMGKSGGSAVGAGMMVIMVLVMAVFMPLMMYVGTFCQCAQVLAASDAVRGIKPDLGGCIRRVDYWLPVKLIATGMVPGLGVLALLTPAVIFFIIGATQKSEPFLIIGGLLVVMLFPLILYVVALVLLLTPVVVLEDVWLMDALRRSMDLSQGARLRNLGVMSIFFLIIMMVSMVAGFIPCLGSIASIAINLLATPLMLIVLVILYYDMLIRRQDSEAAANRMV